MLLHTLNCSADSDAFRDCLRVAGENDTIVLIGDGVYLALPNTSPRLALDANPARIVALDTDTAAAGLAHRLNGIERIDMDGLVSLTEVYPRQVAWY